ncbi:unnamed protein product [Blepharisma stoltei]|uniref:Transmembrane protein n=1 Tax=Blepharisma stoltei TaxID=1481888 RepID=A0AAU9INF0_9CILI|nr:unnamed protein product [Blepharisma stoltei]
MEIKQRGMKNYSNFTDEDEKGENQLKQSIEMPQMTEAQNNLLKPFPSISRISERHTNRMTIKEEEKILNRLQIAAIGILFAPVIVLIAGVMAFHHTNKYFLMFPPFVSLIGICATLCVYFGAKYTKESLTKHIKMLTQWNNIVAQDFFTNSLYILHLVASCFFYIGIVSVISHQNLLESIKDPDISWKVKWALYFISGASLKYIIGYIYIFYLSCKLSIDYENIHNYVQVIQISILISAIGLILCTGIYWLYWHALDISENLAPIITHSGIILGIILLIYTQFSFFAAYKEHISLIILSQIISVILFIFLWLYCMLIVFATKDFQASVSTNCYQLLNIMQDKHLNYLGCKEKYIEIESSKDKLKCDEDQIGKIDENDGEEKYGCLNSDCCEIIRSAASAGLDYIIGFCITGQILLVFALECSRNLLKKIERFGSGGERVMDKRLFGVTIATLLISCAIGFALR